MSSKRKRPYGSNPDDWTDGMPPRSDIGGEDRKGPVWGEVGDEDSPTERDRDRKERHGYEQEDGDTRFDRTGGRWGNLRAFPSSGFLPFDGVPFGSLGPFGEDTFGEDLFGDFHDDFFDRIVSSFLPGLWEGVGSYLLDEQRGSRGGRLDPRVRSYLRMEKRILSPDGRVRATVYERTPEGERRYVSDGDGSSDYLRLGIADGQAGGGAGRVRRSGWGAKRDDLAVGEEARYPHAAGDEWDIQDYGDRLWASRSWDGPAPRVVVRGRWLVIEGAEEVPLPSGYENGSASAQVTNGVLSVCVRRG